MSRYGTEKEKRLLSPWPTPEPADYRKWLNHAQGREEIENIRYAIQRGRPYGSEGWLPQTLGKFGLENTMRNRGRPLTPLTPFFPRRSLTPFGSLHTWRRS